MSETWDLPPPGVLRPSSAERWGNCAGSHRLEGLYPEEDGEEARLGTAAHFFLTEALQGRVWPVGHVTPNGVPITEEMVDAAEACRDFCAAEFAAPFHVEQRVTMHRSVHPACEGTPDIFCVEHERSRITVPDYKFGHRYVDPFRNFQLALYFAGVCEREGLSREVTRGWEVRFAIFQPRNYHPSGPVRIWSALGWQVWALVDDLREAAHKAKDPRAETRTGAHCRDCSARHACEA